MTQIEEAMLKMFGENKENYNKLMERQAKHSNVANCTNDTRQFNITIEDAWANRHDQYWPNGAIGVDWSCDGVGFGRWEAVFDEDGRMHIDSECMDKGDKKAFSKAILLALLENAVIDG